MSKSIMGERLKALREGVKLSQYKLAAINGNILQTAITRYENDTAAPSCETLLWYANYFDVSLDYIFGRTDNPQGKLFDCKSQYITDNKELKEFVEMCFDPNSPVNSKLKDTLLKLLEGEKSEKDNRKS